MKEALRKRQAQVEEQRRAQDEERRKREQFDRDGRRELREAEREARDRDRSVNTKKFHTSIRDMLGIVGRVKKVVLFFIRCFYLFCSPKIALRIKIF